MKWIFSICRLIHWQQYKCEIGQLRFKSWVRPVSAYWKLFRSDETGTDWLLPGDFASINSPIYQPSRINPKVVGITFILSLLRFQHYILDLFLSDLRTVQPNSRSRCVFHDICPPCQVSMPPFRTVHIWSVATATWSQCFCGRRNHCYIEKIMIGEQFLPPTKESFHCIREGAHESYNLPTITIWMLWEKQIPFSGLFQRLGWLEVR